MSQTLSLSDYSSVLKASRVLNIEDLSELLKEALSKTFERQKRNFIMELLETIRMWGENQRLDKKHIKQILDMFEAYFGESLIEYARRPIIQFVYSAYESGLSAMGFSLSQMDEEALNTMKKYAFFWLKNNQSETIQQVMKERFEEYFEKGLTLNQLAEKLEEDLNDILRERKHYWKTVATHWAGTFHNIGTVESYQRAGIQYAKVVAVLDERTTRICRRMHGKIIKVAALVEEKERVINNLKRKRREFKPLVEEKDWERFKKITLKTNEDFYKNKNIPKLPPYHFGCRTTTVAFFKPVEKPQWAREMEKHEVLKNYDWVEIKSKLESIIKLAKEGKLTFPRTRRTYKGKVYNNSLEEHFDRHGHKKYIEAKTPKEYLKKANETIANATHIVIGTFESDEVGEEVPDFRFWDGKRFVAVDMDLRILTFHPMSRLKKWRQKTEDTIKLSKMEIEKGSEEYEFEIEYPMDIVRREAESLIKWNEIWVEEFIYWLSELSDALMAGKKPDPKEWEYLMGLLKEVFERVKKDKKLKARFKKYIKIYTEGENYPESHWWWHALD